MENDGKIEKLTNLEKIQIVLLSIIIISLATGTIGIIAIYSLTYIGLDHVLDLTLGLQGLSTGILIHLYFELSNEELEKTKRNNQTNTSKGIVNIRSTSPKKQNQKKHKTNNIDFELLPVHSDTNSMVLKVLGVLILIGLGIFSAVIGYSKGATVAGIITGVYGGVLGLGVGIILGYLINEIINRALFLLLSSITSIPLGMYLKTLDYIGSDEIVTVIITSFAWSIIIMIFSIFVIIIFSFPNNRFTAPIVRILYH